MFPSAWLILLTLLLVLNPYVKAKWDRNKRKFPNCTNKFDMKFKEIGISQNETYVYLSSSAVGIDFVVLNNCTPVDIKLSIEGIELQPSPLLDIRLFGLKPGDYTVRMTNVTSQVDILTRNFKVTNSPTPLLAFDFTVVKTEMLCWKVPFVAKNVEGLSFEWVISEELILSKELSKLESEIQTKTTNDSCLFIQWPHHTMYVDVKAIVDNEQIILRNVQFVNFIPDTSGKSDFIIHCRSNCHSPFKFYEDIILMIYCYNCEEKELNIVSNLKVKRHSRLLSEYLETNFLTIVWKPVVKPWETIARVIDFLVIESEQFDSDQYDPRQSHYVSVTMGNQTRMYELSPMIEEAIGECVINPKEGYVFHTVFYILCSGFAEIFGIKYTFKYCKEETILKHGNQPWFAMRAKYSCLKELRVCFQVIVEGFYRTYAVVDLYAEIYNETLNVDPYHGYDVSYWSIYSPEFMVYLFELQESKEFIKEWQKFYRTVTTSLSVMFKLNVNHFKLMSAAKSPATTAEKILTIYFQIYFRGYEMLGLLRYYSVERVKPIDILNTLNLLFDWLLLMQFESTNKAESQALLRLVMELTFQINMEYGLEEEVAKLLLSSSKLALKSLLPQEEFIVDLGKHTVYLFNLFMADTPILVVKEKKLPESRVMMASMEIKEDIMKNMFQFGFIIEHRTPRIKKGMDNKVIVRAVINEPISNFIVTYPIVAPDRELDQVSSFFLANTTNFFSENMFEGGDIVYFVMSFKYTSLNRRRIGDEFHIVICFDKIMSWIELEYMGCTDLWYLVMRDNKEKHDKQVILKLREKERSDESLQMMARFLSPNGNEASFSILFEKYYCFHKNQSHEPWKRDICKEMLNQTDPENPRISCNCENSTIVAMTTIISAPVDLLIEKMTTSTDENWFLYYLYKILLRIKHSNSLWPCVMVLSIWMTFFALAIWARVKDRLMKTMSLPIDLADNSSSSRYIYLIIVKTGGRVGAGTTSRVYFNITGTKGVSASHRLVCHKYQVLQRTHTNIFLMRTKSSLGDLVAVKFWHRNKGGSPAWFVSRLSIADLQSKRIYYFLCHAWVGNNDFEDVVIMKTFIVATKIMTYNLKYLISFNASRSFSDNHTLFSIFFCPITSRFNRFERVGVCMNLLVGYLMCNLFFMKLPSDAGGGSKQNLGRLLFSTERIYAAFYCAMIMFPVTTGIEGTFQCVIRRKRMIGIIMDWRKRNIILADDLKLTNRYYLTKLLSNIKDSVLLMRSDSSKMNISKEKLIQPQQKDSERNLSSNSLPGGEQPRRLLKNVKGLSGREDLYNFKPDSWKDMFASEVVVQTTEHTLADYKSEKLENGFLPPICSVLAWTVIISCVVFFSMAVVYGTSEYNNTELLLWAAAVFMSFCIGMILDDPSKIIIASLFYSLVVRKVKEHAFRNSEKYKYMCLRGLEYGDLKNDHETLELMHRTGDYVVPKKSLNMLLLEAAQIKEESRRIIIRLAFYLTITISCIGFALANHDNDREKVLFSMEKLLFKRASFTGIQRIEHFWHWANTTFIDLFYVAEDDLKRNQYYKFTSMETLFMKTGSCIRRTSANPRMWALYLGGVMGDARETICMNLTFLSAKAVIQDAYDEIYLNPEFYFTQLETQAMHILNLLIYVIDVKVYIMPGGGLSTWAEIQSLPLYRTTGDYKKTLVANTLLVVLLTCFIFFTFRSLIYVGVADFFVSFWNLVDLLIGILTIFYIPIVIFYGHDVRNFGKEWDEGKGNQSYDMLMSQSMLKFMSNITVILFVIKGLSYLRHNSKMAMYFDYLWTCVPTVLIVILMSLPIMLGLSTGLYKLFGKRIKHLATQEYALTKFLLHLIKITKFGNLSQINIWAPFIYCLCVLAYIMVFKNLCAAVMLRKHRMYHYKPNFKDQLYFKAVVKFLFKLLYLCTPKKIMSLYKENKRWNKIEPLINSDNVFEETSTLVIKLPSQPPPPHRKWKWSRKIKLGGIIPISEKEYEVKTISPRSGL